MGEGGVADGWGVVDDLDGAVVTEALEMSAGHGAGVEVAFFGPVAEAGFGGEADVFERHAGGTGGLDGVEDGFFGAQGVGAGFVEEGVDGIGGGAIGPVAGEEFVEVHGLEAVDGAEVFVDVHVGGGEGGFSVEEAVGVTVDGVGDDGGVEPGEEDAEVSVGMSGDVEDLEGLGGIAAD